MHASEAYWPHYLADRHYAQVPEGLLDHAVQCLGTEYGLL